MSLTALGGVMPLAWSLFINTKPFVSLVAAFGSGKAACVACALPSLVKGWDQVASCLQDGGGVNGEEQTTAMHLSWQLLTRSQLLFCLCVLLTYFGPPKRSARKWEGAIAMYLAGNKPALLPPLFASSSYATTSTTTILPKGVPESLMHTREGQELVRLIQTDYSHWEKFRVIRDKGKQAHIRLAG
ncbi:hypothetical protein BASA81_010164 [Batrachochytrium salamandrivorans]|nr:hypothetical protein BASA81_010164 [Batrachochytrium salamandrivorans]